jgi:hypothetical protein
MALLVITLLALVITVVAEHALKKEKVTEQTDSPCGRLLRDEELRDLFRDTAVKGGLGSYTMYSDDGSGFEYIHRNEVYPFKFTIRDRSICYVSKDGKVTTCESYAMKDGKIFEIFVNNGPFPPNPSHGGPIGCIEVNFFRPEGRPSRSG